MHNQRGFTYIELLVATALLGLMALMVLPRLSIEAHRSRDIALRQALRELRTAIDRYKQAADKGTIEKAAGSSGYPPSLQVLVQGVEDRSDATGQKKIYFLRRLPRDPTCDCAEMDAADTWQLRSYDSPADDPQPGADVFDVASRSPEKGLNGIPYQTW
jgi:general secretion pathway protein G